MNIAHIATACRLYIDKSTAPECHAEFGKDHLRDMINAIESGSISGEKAHRWLGYLQGVLVATGGCTLDEMKTLNLGLTADGTPTPTDAAPLVLGPIVFHDAAALKKVQYVMTKVNGSEEEAITKAFAALDDELERMY